MAEVHGGEFGAVQLTFNRPIVAGSEYNGSIGRILDSAGSGTELQPIGDLITPSTTVMCDLGTTFDPTHAWSILIPDGTGPFSGSVAYGNEGGQPMPPQCLNVRYVS